MTVDHASSAASPRVSAGDVALDGLFAGMIGALTVAVWFLVLDIAAGRPLYTPALLGQVLLHGGRRRGPARDSWRRSRSRPTRRSTSSRSSAVGLVLSYLMTLFERFPIVGFVLLMLFACLQVGFVVLDAVLGAQLMGKLRNWTGDHRQRARRRDDGRLPVEAAPRHQAQPGPRLGPRPGLTVGQAMASRVSGSNQRSFS